MLLPSKKQLKSSLRLPSTPPPTRARAAEQTCLALLRACTSLLHLLRTTAFLLKSGLHSNSLVLTKFAATSASLDALHVATALLFSPDAPTHLYDTFLFNTLIRSHAHSHLPAAKHQAFSHYSFMLRRHLLPNKFTFPFLLKACAGLPKSGRVGAQVHASAVKFGYGSNLFVQNTLIHMYSSAAGGLDCARMLFDKMPKTSPVTWSAMIGGYVRSGFSDEAVALFREMQSGGIHPDAVAIVSVLSACADLGALELVRWLGSYVERENIPKALSLCNALLDALAKCGDIDGAMALFEQMPVRSIVSWTSVIDGLAMHGRGREAVQVFGAMKSAGVVPDTKELIDKDPMRDSNYVVLSNFYALKRQWHKKWETRRVMSQRGIRKVPGCSLVELDGEIYEFIAGDESHLQHKGMYEMLEEMSRKTKLAGYVPVKMEVLLDIDEEDKEDALHWHSEKLAIAFVLLKTHSRTAIRIVKNLRVCGDCHEAFKFISKVYDREIVVRDANRFHCFKDGFCSCKDFW
ncbi:pentatricopeptide repeat-containing protein [Canna indica]|uniref:Pentatricopeptide repeat-containing protein n=1 Tax=Canna indica TaxID=4628 RepID=A0AAQ3JV33_9LILI|nr:pentatricopeptide repeat-containing protein [Canna indica]